MCGMRPVQAIGGLVGGGKSGGKGGGGTDRRGGAAGATTGMTVPELAQLVDPERAVDQVRFYGYSVFETLLFRAQQSVHHRGGPGPCLKTVSTHVMSGPPWHWCDAYRKSGKMVSWHLARHPRSKRRYQDRAAAVFRPDAAHGGR